MKAIRRLQVFLVLLVCIFLSTYSLSYEKEIKNISTTIADNISNLSKKTVAVVDFTDLQGNVTELGRFLAEEISVALASAAKNFEVVDRTHLKAIIQEHKLSSTGLIDPQTAIRLGQITGVEALVTGTITPFGDSVRLSVKVLDTKTAKLVGACSADIAKTKAIEELLASNVSGQQSSSGSFPPSAGSSQRTGQSIARIQQENYIIEIKKCVLSGTSLTFELLITNIGEERELWLGNSRIITENGEEYWGSDINIGSGGNQKRLPPNVPVKAIVQFEQIKQSFRLISIFELRYGWDKYFRFRNVAVSSS